MGSAESTVHGLFMMNPARINSGKKNTKKLLLGGNEYLLSMNTIPGINSGTKNTKKLLL